MADPWWYPPRGVDGEAWLAAMREADAVCPELAEDVPASMAEARERMQGMYRSWRPDPPKTPRRPRTPSDFSGLHAILANIQPVHGRVVHGGAAYVTPPQPPTPPPAPKRGGQDYADLRALVEEARPRTDTGRLRASIMAASDVEGILVAVADWTPSEPLEPGETHEAYLLRRQHPRPLGTVPARR